MDLLSITKPVSMETSIRPIITPKPIIKGLTICPSQDAINPEVIHLIGDILNKNDNEALETVSLALDAFLKGDNGLNLLMPID